jgi:hypothetical protein
MLLALPIVNAHGSLRRSLLADGAIEPLFPARRGQQRASGLRDLLSWILQCDAPIDLHTGSPNDELPQIWAICRPARRSARRAPAGTWWKVGPRALRRPPPTPVRHYTRPASRCA